MVYPETFSGFQVSGPNKFDFEKKEWTPPPLGDHDVEIKIQACGICGSDFHTISGGWGDQKWPLCVGHGMSFLSMPCHR
jgi:alcohol dehydrogenase (NADP+)